MCVCVCFSTLRSHLNCGTIWLRVLQDSTDCAAASRGSWPGQRCLLTGKMITCFNHTDRSAPWVALCWGITTANLSTRMEHTALNSEMVICFLVYFYLHRQAISEFFCILLIRFLSFLRTKWNPAKLQLLTFFFPFFDILVMSIHYWPVGCLYFQCEANYKAFIWISASAISPVGLK